MRTEYLRAAVEQTRSIRPGVDLGVCDSNTDGKQSITVAGRDVAEDGLPSLVDDAGYSSSPSIALRLDYHGDPWVIGMSPWQTAQVPS